MRAEYLENKGCQQRDSAEREEYAGARSIDRQEAEEADGAELLEGSKLKRVETPDHVKMVVWIQPFKGREFSPSSFSLIYETDAMRRKLHGISLFMTFDIIVTTEYVIQRNERVCFHKKDTSVFYVVLKKELLARLGAFFSMCRWN